MLLRGSLLTYDLTMPNVLERASLLGDKLRIARTELREKTDQGILFSQRLEDFVLNPAETLLESGDLSKGRAISLTRLGYQAWVAVQVILALNPNSFFHIGEDVKIHNRSIP